MKHKLFKTMIAISSIAMICACGDDSGNTSEPNNGGTDLSSSSAQQNDNGGTIAEDPCAKYKVVTPGWVEDLGNGDYLVIDQASTESGRGIVYDTAGKVTSYYFTLEVIDQVLVGHVYDSEGIWIDMNMSVKPFCQANTTPNGQPTSSASTSPENPNNPTSSAATNPENPNNPTSSAATNPENPNSSAETTVPEESSSSAEPEIGPDGFPTIESYGPPPAEYTKDISATAKRGWNTRYWDACKPHCSWISDGQEGKTDTTTEETYQAGMTTARNCNIHDVEVPTFTLGSAVKSTWFGYEGTNSACTNAKEKGVFTCTDMAPIQVTENLSYAYVAGTAEGKCGKCFHLQYDGSFKDASENNKPKATHQALKGKHMIVMASNIGKDVAGGNAQLPAGQFDLMVPGGGVGAFDALSIQVNGANVNWGAGFGGFLTECQSKLGYDSTLAAYQTCVKDMCDAAFGNAGLPNLLRGCHWFADWYMAADNPTYYIEEVECPQYLIDHYLTRINLHKDNNYKWHDDWSTFKEGDELDTLHCWKPGEGPAEQPGWTNPNAGCEVK